MWAVENTFSICFKSSCKCVVCLGKKKKKQNQTKPLNFSALFQLCIAELFWIIIYCVHAGVILKTNTYFCKAFSLKSPTFEAEKNSTNNLSHYPYQEQH